MNTRLRERIRAVVAVALAVPPRRIKLAYAEKNALKSDHAQRQLAEAVTTAILRGYDLVEKAKRDDGAGALYRGPGVTI